MKKRFVFIAVLAAGLALIGTLCWFKLDFPLAVAWAKLVACLILAVFLAWLMKKESRANPQRRHHIHHHEVIGDLDPNYRDR